MELEFVQTFIPIVHTGIDKGIVSKALSWLEEYWWIPVAIIGAFGIFWYFNSKKEQSKQNVQPVEEKPKPTVEINLLNKPYSPTST